MKYFRNYCYDKSDYSYMHDVDKKKTYIYIRKCIRNVIMALKWLYFLFFQISWVNTLLTKYFNIKYHFTRIINIKSYFVLSFYLTTPTPRSCTINFQLTLILTLILIIFFQLWMVLLCDNENDLIYELAIILINCIAYVVYTR